MKPEDQVVASVIATLHRKHAYMSSFHGPLGGHRNYLTHVALPNCFEYLSLQKHHAEINDISTHAKYEELRRFLNSIESLNNTLEYAYYELKEHGHNGSFSDFRNAAWNKYPELSELADLANAYKHSERGQASKNPPSAKRMQKPQLHITVMLSKDRNVQVDADYMFEGPLAEHLDKFDRALKFWFEYHNSPTSTQLTDLLRVQSA
jgi:hypothetical protein